VMVVAMVESSRHGRPLLMIVAVVIVAGAVGVNGAFAPVAAARAGGDNTCGAILRPCGRASRG
jgi:hypothetical protein